MSKERSDSMGITESPFSTADSHNMTHISEKTKENLLFLMKNSGFFISPGML